MRLGIGALRHYASFAASLSNTLKPSKIVERMRLPLSVEGVLMKLIVGPRNLYTVAGPPF